MAGGVSLIRIFARRAFLQIIGGFKTPSARHSLGARNIDFTVNPASQGEPFHAFQDDGPKVAVNSPSNWGERADSAAWGS